MSEWLRELPVALPAAGVFFGACWLAVRPDKTPTDPDDRDQHRR